MLLRSHFKVSSFSWFSIQLFAYHVSDPERFGVVEFDNLGNVISLEEKPKLPKSNIALTGLYFFDENAPERAKKIIPSARGELEITSLLEIYLEEGSLVVETMGRGIAWLDTGTHASMLDASNFVRTLTERQGMQVGSPDEIAFRNAWISKTALRERSELFSKNEYGAFLARLADS